MARIYRNNFNESLISALGLAISSFTAILPLITKGVVTDLFIIKNIAAPVSFIVFIAGIAIFWQLIQFSSFPQINLFSRRDATGRKIYKINLERNSIVTILLILIVISGFIFLSLNLVSNPRTINLILGISQALTYLIFFLSLIGLFSLLFAQTRNQYKWQEGNENYNQTIVETLEKYGYIKPYIQILEKTPLMGQQLQGQYKIPNVYTGTLLKIKLMDNPPKEILIIVSMDGKDIIKVLRQR